MRVQQTKSVVDKANFSAFSKLPEFTVSKLIAENYDIFTAAFCFVLGRTIVMDGIPIDYFMCDVTGSCDSPWTNLDDKLKICLLHTGNYFKNDNITLYFIYSWYIGTKVVVSNIINNYHSTKNGRKFHQDFELHFRNYAYLTNKATTDTSTMNNAVYNVDRKNFTLENYYKIMSKSLNDLSTVVSAHDLKIWSKWMHFNKA